MVESATMRCPRCQQDNPPQAKFCLECVYRRTGQRDRAHEHFAGATTMCREMGMTYWLEKVTAEMRDLA